MISHDLTRVCSFRDDPEDGMGDGGGSGLGTHGGFNDASMKLNTIL